MFRNPFRLRSIVSTSALADEDDTFNTKKALGSLGYYKASKQGLAKIADSPLFEGIKRFQSDNGLKRDGVMKPGGETERTLGELLAERQKANTQTPSPRPATKPIVSLLDRQPTTRLGIMPGEHDWQKRQTLDIARPEQSRRINKQTHNIKSFLELIARKARDNDVVAESARTVKAAIKTSDQTGLAKFHATAVKEFGDDALAEITDFNTQLKAADPQAHNSWLRAFTEELPDEAERMMLAGSVGEGSLTGGASNDLLGDEKIQNNLNGKNEQNSDQPDASIPPFPANKEEFLAGQEGGWEAQHDAFQNLPGSNKMESHVYMEIFGQEGGIKPDPKGSAVGGIRKETINELIDRGFLTGIPANSTPSDLTPEQRAQVYRAYFDDVLHTVGGADALSTIEDPMSAAAFGDTMFRDGRGAGPEAIQNAIVIIAPQQYKNLDVDGKMGPETLAAFRQLSENPTTRAKLLDALANQRKNNRPSESGRFNYYRAQKTSPNT